MVHEILPEALNVVSAFMFFDDLSSFAQEQRDDPQLSAVIDSLQTSRSLQCEPGGLSNRYLQIWNQLQLSEGGVLVRRFKHKGIFVRVPIIPARRRNELLEECHGSAHMGSERTYDLLRVNAHWPGLQTEVCNFVWTLPVI